MLNSSFPAHMNSIQTKNCLKNEFTALNSLRKEKKNNLQIRELRQFNHIQYRHMVKHYIVTKLVSLSNLKVNPKKNEEITRLVSFNVQKKIIKLVLEIQGIIS